MDHEVESSGGLPRLVRILAFCKDALINAESAYFRRFGVSNVESIESLIDPARFDLIVVKDLSQLSRSSVRAQELVSRMVDSKIRFIALDDGIIV